MSVKSIIVAVDENNAIGKNNNLLCHLPNDLKYFKSVTSGRTVIMGRKTFESLPNGALPNRRNIVITSQNLKIEGCEVCHSLPEAFELCEGEDEIFVIGGAMLYKEAIGVADKLYVTHIKNAFVGADAFFPVIDNDIWKKESEVENLPDDKNSFVHSFVRYIRRSCWQGNS